MRRVLILFATAIPALASAQTGTPATGGILLSPSTMNIAQCSGTAVSSNSTKVPPLTDVPDLSLLWNVKLLSGNTTGFTTPGSFKVWASTQQFQAANASEPFSCFANASGASITPTQIGTTYDAPQQITAVAKTINLQSIASALSQSCTTAGTSLIYLCVEWIPTAGSVAGWATGTLTLDTTLPTAPTGITLSPGDSKLHVTGCTGGSGGSTFMASATPAGGGTPVWSGKATSCSGITINHLVNDQPYDVVVYAMNSANNPSLASPTSSGTPIPTNDFWDHYKGDNGQEQGGCSTGLGAGLLGALSLLAVRRRKP